MADGFSVRTDGAIVVPLREYSPDADSVTIVAQNPDGTSAGTLEVPAASTIVRASAADQDNRVYMLVDSTVRRFDPDVSLNLVHEPEPGALLRDVSTTATGGVVILGTDDVDYVEHLCED